MKLQSDKRTCKGKDVQTPTQPFLFENAQPECYTQCCHLQSMSSQSEKQALCLLESFLTTVMTATARWALEHGTSASWAVISCDGWFDYNSSVCAMGLSSLSFPFYFVHKTVRSVVLRSLFVVIWFHKWVLWCFWREAVGIYMHVCLSKCSAFCRVILIPAV